MAIGTGTPQIKNLPVIPYVINTNGFIDRTEHDTISKATASPGSGAPWQQELLAQGLLGRLMVQFQGQVVIALGAGSATTTRHWPYGLLSSLALQVNGSTNLHQGNGEDFHARRVATNPAWTVNNLDAFPGTVGGGDVLTSGTFGLTITWEIPVWTDPTSMAGMLYLQSITNDVVINAFQELTANLITLAGGATAVITGTYNVLSDLFSIPRNNEGAIILPEGVTRLHSFVFQETALTTASGENTLTLTRNQQAQLMRLFVQVRASDTSIVQPIAADGRLNSIKIMYGSNHQPLFYDPAEFLTAINNQYYGVRLPYGYLCFDFVRENMRRDIVQLGGVPDFRIVPNVTLVIGANSGLRVVQETVYGVQ